MKKQEFIKKYINQLDQAIKLYEEDEDILEDGEMLADILLVAVNNVLDQVKKEKERKLSKYGSGLGGLF